MYEALEPHADDFQRLRKTLADPTGSARVDAIRAALDTVAQQISATRGETDIDRNNLAKLYRGFVAASRVVGSLQEQAIAART